MYKTINPRSFCVVSLLMYIANAYILGNDRMAGRNAWLCLLCAAVTLMPLFFAFSYLAKKYPGKDLFAIFFEVFGKKLTKIICALYTVYAVFLLSMSFGCFSDFVSSNILTATPRFIMAAAVAAVSLYLATRAVIKQARWAAFLLPVVLLFIALTLISSIPSLHPEYILPVAEDKRRFIYGCFRYLTFPVGEPIILFSLLPNIKNGIKLRHWLLPWTISALILSISFARDTMVLGGALSGVLYYSTNIADSITGYTNFTQRTEVITSMIPAAAVVMESAIVIRFLSQAINAGSGGKIKKSGAVFGTVIAVVIFLFAYQTNIDLERRAAVWPLVSLTAQALIPVFCLLTCALKTGIRRKKLAHRLKKKIM